MPPGLSQNLTDEFFVRWLAALDLVYTESGMARVAFIGDSTTEGTGAGSFQQNFVQQLKALLNGSVSTIDGAIHGVADDYPDGRIVLGSGWSTVSLSSWGPRTLTTTQNITATPAATGDLQITFPHAFDTITVTYPKNTTLGTFTVNVDGGASLGSVDTAGAIGVAQTTFTCTPGTHTIRIPPPTGGDVFILGVEAYLSTSPSVLLANGASGGTTTADWTASSPQWARLAMLDIYQPDLTVIMLGVNDAAAGVSAATFETNLTTIVTKAQLYGDVLIMSVVPSSGSTIAALELQYLTKAIAVSTAKSCGFLDINAAFVDYVTANAAGLMSDVFHPSGTGYTVIAYALLDLFAENIDPDAAFTVEATLGIEMKFDGTSSDDPDGTIASYEWDYGDGGTGIGAVTRHVYATAGAYTVSLTVTDNRGGTNTKEADVLVASPCGNGEIQSFLRGDAPVGVALGSTQRREGK